MPLFARVFRIGLLVLGAGVLFKIHDADELIAFYDNGHGPLSELPLWLQAVLFLVLSDFMLYWLHRMFHGGGFWKYHAIHHSSEDLDWISAARFHPVNLLLGTIRVDVVLLMAGISPNVMLWVGPFNIFHSAFVHANLNWTLGPFKYVLATPVFHRWHHTSPRRGRQHQFRRHLSALGYPVRDLPDAGKQAAGPLWRRRPARLPGRDRRAIGLSVPELGCAAGGFLGSVCTSFTNCRSDLPRRAPVPLRIAFAGLSTPRGRVCRSVPCVFAHARVFRISVAWRWHSVVAGGQPGRARPLTPIAVNVDQAKLVKLPAEVATIVVGNPLIADVTLQNGGIVVVTGKGYGATNFIAMDRAGEVLVDRLIQVEGPTDQLVTDLSRRRTRDPIAACRSASAGLRLATARTTSRRRSIRPALSAVRPAAAPPRQANRRTDRSFQAIASETPGGVPHRVHAVIPSANRSRFARGRSGKWLAAG